MDGEVISKIEELVKGSIIVEADGKKWATHSLYPVQHTPEPATVQVTSLSGLKGFVSANLDNIDFKNECLCIVDDIDSVAIVSKLTGKGLDRHEYLRSTLDDNLNSFPFDVFTSQDKFIILLHSLFEKGRDDDFEYVAKTVAKITQANSSETEDDGITQRVTVKKGVSGALTEKNAIKHIVRLSPYRTFREVKQPTSEFLLRIKPSSDGVEIALFEADGGSWRIEAKANIVEYLKDIPMRCLA